MYSVFPEETIDWKQCTEMIVRNDIHFDKLETLRRKKLIGLIVYGIR